MEAATKAAMPAVSFDTSPDRYRHWKLAFDGPIATLSMDVQEDAGLSADYRLKLNSYDLGVDIELADAIQRIRFEHPEVRAVIVTSLKERICCGGGYELALACDEILLVDDGNSAVSLPETPLLGVLPGTGGLTRVVDKRKVRRDVADFFATVAEGVKGKRAVEWRLVGAGSPTSQFKQRVATRAQELAAKSDRPATGPGIT